MAISLGSHDDSLDSGALDAVLAEMRRLSGAAWTGLRDDAGEAAPFRPVESGEALGVAEVQRALIDAGFFDGGRVDGICGYRTRAAIRLFQEYVRSVERRPCLPDGIVGPKTGRELRRWRDESLAASWSPQLAAWNFRRRGGGTDEFDDWLGFLGALASRRRDAPDTMESAVAAFVGQSDTRAASAWRTGADDIHLIGIRHGEKNRFRTFDDVLVLLVKGIVCKFQASTDPGATSHPRGAPFLVRGQHDFRTGLHRGSYHALRPLSHADGGGVLVVRCRDGVALTEEDVAAGVETNGTINIHWGGKGLGFPVGSWSEGCQVVAGGGYQNHAGDIVDCLDHVALNNRAVAESRGRKTRGAYNVLSDLIVAMSSDLAEPGVVRYTLLHESELALEAGLADRVAGVRARASARIADSVGR